MSLFDAGLPNRIAFPSGAPLRITEYTTGSGTFVPHPASTYRREVIVGAGGGAGGAGSNPAGSGSPGAQAGGLIERWEINTRLPIAYSVGAAGGGGAVGIVGTAGGDTTFGSATASGGEGGFASAAGTTPYETASHGEAARYGTYGKGGRGATPNTAGGAGTGGFIRIEEF